MKSAGETRPSLGCCQRTSASKPDSGAIVQPDNRLVDDIDGLFFQRNFQVINQHDAVIAAGSERRTEGFDPVAAKPFGMQRRQFSIAHQEFGLGLVLGPGGNADGRRQA